MNGNKIYRTLLTATIVAAQSLLLGSCTVESLDNGATGGKDGSTLISFEGGLEMATPGKAATRGARADAENLSFGVSASVYPAADDYTTAECSNYFRNMNVTTANPETTYLWPSNIYRISFYAYSPYNGTGITLASASSVGRMTYSYTADESVANQCDLMTAEVLDQTCPSADPVELNFSHRLSEFTFRVINNTPDAITVHSVRLMNFRPSGTWDGTAWTPSGSPTYWELSVEQDVASGGILNLTGTSNHFYLVPQTKAAMEDMIRLTITKSGEATPTVFLHQHPTAFTAEAGRSYAFDLTISSGMEVSDASDISGWVMEASYVDYATSDIKNWDANGQPIDHAIDGGIDPWD